MAHAVVAYGRGHLDLDRQRMAVVTLDDQIDLVVAVARSDVTDARTSSLSVDTHAQSHERLEQASSQRAVSGERRSHLSAPQQTVPPRPSPRYLGGARRARDP